MHARTHARAVIALCVLVAVYLRCRHPGAESDQGSDAAHTTTLEPRSGDAIARAAFPRFSRVDHVAGTWQLVGQTLDLKAQPVAGATITLDRARTTISGADGSFAFDELGGVDHYITAEKGLAYGETMVAGDQSTPTVITLGPAPTLVIHVVDRTGTSISGATIQMVSTSHLELTDRDGKATFRSSNFSDQFNIVAPGYASQRRTLDLGDDPHRTVDAKVTLAPSVPIGGVVIDQDGKPVAGASVMACVMGPVEWYAEVAADAKGHWTMDGIGTGRVELSASSDVTVTVPAPYVQIGTKPRLELVVHVERGATISGVAVDLAGTPLAGVNVSVWFGGDGVTNDHGRFLIANVIPGTPRVEASLGTLGAASQLVDVPRGGHVELRLEMVESSIAGVVTSRSGEPVANAGVFMHATHGYTIRQYSARTDSSGRFELQGVPPGEYSLDAERDGSYDHTPEVIVHTGDRNLVVEVPDIGSIHGRVVLDGVPVDFFGAVATTRMDDALVPAPQSSPDGRFVLDNVEYGSVSVVLVGPSFQRRVIEGVVVATSGPTELGDLAVTGGRTVRGHVVDASGAPVANASVVVQQGQSLATVVSLRDQATGSRGTRSDASGRFVVVGLPDEVDLEIQAQQPDHGLAQPRPLTAADLDRDLELVLVATGSVSGTAIDDPSSTEWATVRVTSMLDGRSYTVHAPDDEFAIDQLSPGDYVASLDDDPEVPGVAFHVEANQTTTISFTPPVDPDAVSPDP